MGPGYLALLDFAIKLGRVFLRSGYWGALCLSMYSTSPVAGKDPAGNTNYRPFVQPDVELCGLGGRAWMGLAKSMGTLQMASR